MRSLIGSAVLVCLIAGGVLLSPVRADDACNPSTCPGLEGWRGVERMRADAVDGRNAARLAYSIGISLLREGCCYRDLVSYLRFALETEPALEEEFFLHMNRPSAVTWGMWARVLLAVSGRPGEQPVRLSP